MGSGLEAKHSSVQVKFGGLTQFGLDKLQSFDRTE